MNRPWKSLNNEQKRLLPFVVLSYLGGIAIDAVIPLGYADGVFFILPVVLVAPLGHFGTVLIATILSTLCVGVGYFTSAESPISPSIPVFNRIITIAALWTVSLLIVSRASLFRKLRQAEEVLRLRAEAEEGKSILEAILENIPSGLLVAEAPNGALRAVSRSITSWVTASSSPLIGNPKAPSTWGIRKMDLSIPEHEELPTSRVLRNGETVRGEEWVLCPDGRECIYLSIDAGAVKDSKGNIIGAVSSWRDITSEKKNLWHIQRNEQRIQALFDNAALGIILIDADGKITEANRRSEELLGYRRDELLKLSVKDLTTSEDWEMTAKVHSQLQEQKMTTVSYEKRFLKKDGSQFWGHVTISVVKGEDGTPSHFIGTFEDVSERKRTEQLLKDAEERFRSLFMYHRAVMLLIEPESGIIADANQAAERFYGYSRRELTQMKIQQINQLSEPEVATMRKLAAESKQEHFLFPHKSKTGSVRWVDVYSSPICAGGKTLLCSIIHDVTDRVEMEEQLRYERDFNATIVNSTNAVIVTLDEKGEVVHFNPAAERLTGYSLSDIKGHPFWNFLIAPEEVETIKGVFSAIGQGGLPVEHENFWISKDGARHFIRFANAALCDRHGRRKLIISTGIDITDRVESLRRIEALNLDLRRRAQELANSNQELEAFVYSASHDLRSPLRSIAGFSQILLEDYAEYLDEEGIGHVHRINTGVERMGRLIDDLLFLSRVSRQELRITSVDLTSMAERILRKLSETDSDRRVSICVQRNMVARGDEGLLDIALTNLLGNAWKFSSKKAAKETRIDVGVYKTDHQKVYYVKDNGVGFNPTYQDKLFRPFQRLHSQDQFEGAGIGLATVDRVIRRHGGKVWGEGNVEMGAAFYFTLGDGDTDSNE